MRALYITVIPSGLLQLWAVYMYTWAFDLSSQVLAFSYDYRVDESTPRVVSAHRARRRRNMSAHVLTGRVWFPKLLLPPDGRRDGAVARGRREAPARCCYDDM
ncbi:hypothetical protein MTO96_001990 [Rhipicephalus appendiculatus]